MSKTSDRYDAFRKGTSVVDADSLTVTRSKVVVTRGVHAQGPAYVLAAVEKVREYSEFKAEDDPYGEHDFGAFMLGDFRLNWKIDDYKGHDGLGLVLTIAKSSEM